MDWTPIDIFPAITRVMVEWCEATRGCNCDKENAQALARAIGALTGALERCLEDLNDESQPPPPDPPTSRHTDKELMEAAERVAMRILETRCERQIAQATMRRNIAKDFRYDDCRPISNALALWWKSQRIRPHRAAYIMSGMAGGIVGGMIADNK